MTEHDNAIGRLQSTVEHLERQQTRAENSRQGIHHKLEEIQRVLSPIAEDVRQMKPAWESYQTDKTMAKRLVYGLVGIATVLGVTLSEIKAWIVHWFTNP